jgi:hypothetical protein
MILLALLFGVFFLPGYALFNVGGSVPESGLGEVLEEPVAPARASRPALKIKPAGHVTIFAGTGFKPRELVRLTGAATTRVRTSAHGTFAVRTRTGDPCPDLLALVAVGSKGSRASIQLSQLHCVDQ